MKISVIIPTFNSGQYIKQAIESILNQTFQDFEIIVIDNNSVDDTVEIIKSFNNPKIKIVKCSCAGIPNALNTGIDLAEGEYIARMDSDDISLPDRFEKQVKFLDEHKDCVLCSGLIRLFDDNELKNVEGRSMGYDETKIELLFATPVFHPTVMFRNKFFKENNIKYDETYKTCEDYEIWSRISRIGNIAVLPDILLNYRVNNSNKATITAADLTRTNHAQVIQNQFKYYGINLPVQCCEIIDPFNGKRINKLKRIFYYIKIRLAFSLLIKINKNKKIFNEKMLEAILNKHLSRIECKLFKISKLITSLNRRKYDRNLYGV